MIDLGAALELIHSATLLHDDIIDEGEIANAGALPRIASLASADTLVAGDFLFLRKPSRFAVGSEETIVRWPARPASALTEGEIHAQRACGATLSGLRRRIRGDHRQQTACLFRAGARIAARLAGAERTPRPRCWDAVVNRSAWRSSSVDDLLDVVGRSLADMGKPVGIDLRDGNPSLPIVLALPRSPALVAVWRRADPTEADVSAGLAEIVSSGAVERVRKEAIAYTEAASGSLASLPPTTYRDLLETLIAELRDRAY